MKLVGLYDWLDVYIIYTFEFFDCKFKINILFSPQILLMFLRPYQNPLDRYYWSFNTVSPQNRHALFRNVTILVIVCVWDHFDFRTLTMSEHKQWNKWNNEQNKTNHHREWTICSIYTNQWMYLFMFYVQICKHK